MKRRKKASAGRHGHGERFIMVPRALLTHPDWTQLPATARVIFIDMCMIHHHGGKRGPSNNGQIGYGCAAGAKAANVSVSTANRMLEKLCEVGLVKVEKKGVFKVKAGKGRATEWEITIYPIAGRPPISWGESKLHIEHRLLDSTAYKGLSNPAKCTLIELMRRYDGGNNGHISFGGPDGAHAGFSADVTGRALVELQRAGFIIQTAPAVPYLGHPRKWRLTMYAADSRPATKDFMRDPKPMTPEKSFDGFTGAVESAQNVSVMRAMPLSNSPTPSTMASLSEEISSFSEVLSEKGPILDSRASETFDAADTRTSEIHLEASPPASRRGGSLASYAAPLLRPPPVRAGPPEEVKKFGATGISAETVIERPAGLLGDALPSAPTPLDRLRLELREVLIRKRGTQSRLAEALSLSRPTFTNALSGRERFTATAVAALRRWLDGEPIAGDWPPQPPVSRSRSLPACSCAAGAR